MNLKKERSNLKSNLKSPFIKKKLPLKDKIILVKNKVINLINNNNISE
jgi:hypothetical protein